MRGGCVATPLVVAGQAGMTGTQSGWLTDWPNGRISSTGTLATWSEPVVMWVLFRRSCSFFSPNLSLVLWTMQAEFAVRQLRSH